MRSLFLLILYCFCVSSLWAQKIEMLDQGILEVRYTKRTVTDTLLRANDYREERDMILRVGKQVSSFFSYRAEYLDSLCAYNPELYLQLPVEQRNLKGPKEKERIFKNWPLGKVTVFNHFGLSHHTYSENWEKPAWEICDSVEIVLGFSCQMATANFRGRKWFAFFTTEIPVNDGPWKLCGLPGLILKAYDEMHDYVFVATAINAESVPDVADNNYMGHSWEKKTRDAYYKAWHKALHEDIGKTLAQTGAFNLSSIQLSEISNRKLPHRNYDFEETDY